MSYCALRHCRHLYLALHFLDGVCVTSCLQEADFPLQTVFVKFQDQETGLCHKKITLIADYVLLWLHKTILKSGSNMSPLVHCSTRHNHVTNLGDAGMWTHSAVDRCSFKMNFCKTINYLQTRSAPWSIIMKPTSPSS